MSTRTLGMSEEVWRYLLDVTVQEAPLLARLRDTSRRPRAAVNPGR